MTEQSLNFGKFMTDQGVDTFDHVWRWSIISAPDIYPQTPCLESFWNSPILMKEPRSALLLVREIFKLGNVAYLDEF